MNPATKNTQYQKVSSDWKKCRDSVAGEGVVHEAGEEYVQRLSGQTDYEYKAYLKRTPFYNATARTIDGMVGMIFRKDPSIEVPDLLIPIIEDMTLTDSDIEEVGELLSREILEVGRVGVLVEYPVVSEQPSSLAQADASNNRPYCTIYKAESIINWREERINNSMQLAMVTLMEAATEYVNEFESISIEQVRALLLTDAGYMQRLYRKSDKTGEWMQFGDDIIPIMNGASLSYIPMVLFNANGGLSDVSKPPMLDLVNINLSHYRTSADLEHGAHFTGLPTAVISGYQNDSNDKFSIGSTTAWVFPQPDAKAVYLEFTGQGLGALESLKKEKEAAMAALGSRMLAPEKSGVEASSTLRMRHNGEGAVLSSIVNVINEGLEKVLEIMSQWIGATGDIEVEFNKDFMSEGLTAQEVLAYVQAWQAGALPKEELFYNLKQGEIIRSETTYEEYDGGLETEEVTIEE